MGKGGKRKIVLGGMIRQFQNNMDSIRDKEKNEREKKKKKSLTDNIIKSNFKS